MMRARRGEAKQWEIRCDRDFLYAGSGRSSTVAAWKQAARAEVAAASGEQYAQPRSPYNSQRERSQVRSYG